MLRLIKKDLANAPGMNYFRAMEIINNTSEYTKAYLTYLITKPNLNKYLQTYKITSILDRIWVSDEDELGIPKSISSYYPEELLEILHEKGYL